MSLNLSLLIGEVQIVTGFRVSLFQILAGQDFSPWSKYAEETEMWGQQALEAVARKPAFYSDKYESDSGMVSRLRAISLASSVPDQYAAKVRRQLSTQAKLSSSAPYQQGALQQKCDRGDVVALKTGAEAALPTTGLLTTRMTSTTYESHFNLRFKALFEIIEQGGIFVELCFQFIFVLFFFVSQERDLAFFPMLSRTRKQCVRCHI